VRGFIISLTEFHTAYFNVEKLPSHAQSIGKRYSYFNIVHIYFDIEGLIYSFGFYLESAFPIFIFMKLRFQPSENVLF
jgi:hypothetical protein